LCTACPTKYANLWAYWTGAGTLIVPCSMEQKYNVSHLLTYRLRMVFVLTKQFSASTTKCVFQQIMHMWGEMSNMTHVHWKITCSTTTLPLCTLFFYTGEKIGLSPSGHSTD
jgi:hypothetical protein